jgi:hypothetical protein
MKLVAIRLLHAIDKPLWQWRSEIAAGGPHMPRSLTTLFKSDRTLMNCAY